MSGVVISVCNQIPGKAWWENDVIQVTSFPPSNIPPWYPGSPALDPQLRQLPCTPAPPPPPPPQSPELWVLWFLCESRVTFLEIQFYHACLACIMMYSVGKCV